MVVGMVLCDLCKVFESPALSLLHLPHDEGDERGPEGEAHARHDHAHRDDLVGWRRLTRNLS